MRLLLAILVIAIILTCCCVSKLPEEVKPQLNLTEITQQDINQITEELKEIEQILNELENMTSEV